MAINFKELASKTGEKAKNLGEKGWAASKDFMTKASEKAQDLSEKGMTAIEIKQLQSQEKKLVAQLGQTVHKLLIEDQVESINIDTPDVKATLLEIAAVQEEITKKNKILTPEE
ncbi:MAG: hypothetical protein LBB43_02440 [Spirochaetaceae bacterium]|jgi:hypothetical protein|nr:hypothetical protein [Spirochaetaceae bacterium]